MDLTDDGQMELTLLRNALDVVEVSGRFWFAIPRSMIAQLRIFSVRANPLAPSRKTN